MTAERFDAVVVGAGFAGSLVADRLGRRGWRVLVLEAGAEQPPAEQLQAFRTAVAKVPGSALAPNAVVPSPEVLDLAARDGGGHRATGHLLQNGELPYGSGYLRANGGSGLAWTGLTPRMHPEDFRAGDFGPARSWPIGYDELEPYYRAAEREIGVAADADEQRVRVGLPLPEGYVFPMRPVPPSYLDQVVAAGLDGRSVRDPADPRPTPVELRVVGTPSGRATTPATFPATAEAAEAAEAAADRPACAGSASCIPVCPTGAKYTPLSTQRRWPPTVQLRTQAVVSRVLVDAGGRATGVEYQAYRDPASPRHTRHTVHADVVVLAAHAVENARLMLAGGLANSSDQLGRNLMDHPVLLTWGLMPEQTGPYRGPGSTSGIEGFRFGAARAHRAPFRIEIGNWGWSWAVGPVDGDIAELLHRGDPAAPTGIGLFGKELRQAARDRIGRQFALQFEMEQEADPANRVTLDHARRDLLGNPRPVLTYGLSDYVKRGMAAAKAVSDQLFALLGAEDHTAHHPGLPGYFEYQGAPLRFHGAGHGAGTHIMGDSPATSVVDSAQRCWDHPGLYAVGCGSMPSVGTSNPSLTMAAMALLSCERIHQDLTNRHRISLST
ncbi:choline dehydrogenase-like flavoprotein [Kitasatospora sp. MAP12-15]|uniref:GMC family oxidoreductase n=1 Tax=unclassified Kitasatospora TaxID=2633591 RepID=UPI002475BF40|nr:GMC family oxidoreductase [Kitasatospora sp. MAP12-44]MDH6113811.1 choline dehydrogenase-like flavoprotein [Kitasatospora sp. MAP12-44]